MKNILIFIILAVILGLAIGYIVKAKRKGKRCIGCPYADECGTKNCTCKNN